MSDGAWLGQVGASLRADLEELADLRIRHGIASAQIDKLCAQLDQIVELVRTPKPPVEGKDHSWKAPDPVEAVKAFVAPRQVLPPDLVARAAISARALEYVGDDGAGPKSTQTAAQVLRDIVSAVRVRPPSR